MHVIVQVFLTKELTGYGKYKLRLYDGIKKSWQTIVVDDWIPCSATTGKPMFAKTNDDNAAWVLLLEKAMAKFKVKGVLLPIIGPSLVWIACDETLQHCHEAAASKMAGPPRNQEEETPMVLLMTMQAACCTL